MNYHLPRVQHTHTMVIMASEVLLTNVQVVVFVKFPELAVDNVEVLVRKEVTHLIYILLLTEHLQCL